MPRRSVATVRDQPVERVTSASGAFLVRAESFTVDTHERTEVLDLTDRVMAIVRALGVREGMVNLCSMHTTCTVFINEFQLALRADFLKFFEHLVETDAAWLHNDPTHSDCDRANADSHLRAMILGHTLSMQVSGGELVLGQWQRVLMAELDGPRTRTLRVSVMGVAGA
jgi:secondary thiamine-phosphate synthase enzyme